jgi:hypothetical protein
VFSLLDDTRSSSREKIISAFFQAESNDPGIDPGFYLIEKPLDSGGDRVSEPLGAPAVHKERPSWQVMAGGSAEG